MIGKRGLLFVIAVAAGSSLAWACGGGGAEKGPTAIPTAPAPVDTALPEPDAGQTPDAEPAPEAAVEPHGRGLRGGPTEMLFSAAQQIDLKPEQKTKIADLQAKLRADKAPKDEMKALRADLVAGVKAGKLDKAKMSAHKKAIATAVKAHQDKEADALDALHAALEPAQRKEVVAKVRAAKKARDEKVNAKLAASKKKDGGAATAKKKKKGGPAAGNPLRHRLRWLTKDLGLDAGQQKKIDALAAKQTPKSAAKSGRAERSKRVDALLTAFEKDKFEAKKLKGYDGKTARAPFEDEASLLGKVLPILKPEQREKLAAKLAEPPPRGHQGEGHGPMHQD